MSKEASDAQGQDGKGICLPSCKTNLVLAVATALIASLYVGYVLWLASPYFDKISDLPEYVTAARLYAEGHGSSAYVTPEWIAKRTELFPTLRPRGLSIFSPPQTLFLWTPLAMIPLKFVAGFFLALQLLASAACLFLLKRLFSLNSQQTVLLWAGLIFSGPLFESLLIGQITPFLLLALLIAMVALEKQRPLLAAIALCLFIQKPQEIATFAVFLIGARKYKVVLYGLLAAAVLTIATFITAGPQAFSHYFDLLKNLDALSALMAPQITPTIRGQMLRAGINIELVGLVSKTALLAALAASFYLGNRLRNSADWVKLGVLATLPVGLLTAFYVQSYDLLILAPCAISLFSYKARGGIDRLLLIAAAISLSLFIQPIFRYIHYNMYPSKLNLHFVGLAIFALACVIVAVQQALSKNNVGNSQLVDNSVTRQ